MTADEVVPPEVERLAGLVGPGGDEILAEMEAHADEESFPIVGPAVGGWFALLARAVDARRVFEFGSGFGYSAYWFARALSPDGEVVLTEIDKGELDLAREFFDRAGFTDRARFEHGDALEIVQRYDGPFDVVLLDNEKGRYREAFEAVEPTLRSGSLVLADNAVTAGTVVDRDEVVRLLAGEDIDARDGSEGIAEYIAFVRERDHLDTSLLPLGEGVAVSRVR
ncbi:MAG: putative O-methyltransferase [halophilic archaeon J07HX64]|jgi:Predicted O-methyltransferase|nr:MAG: putative O-methyltransferase [halophilic archaeon J07HX64]